MAINRFWVIRRELHGEYVYVSQKHAPGMQFVTTKVLMDGASFRTKREALRCGERLDFQGEEWAIANLEHRSSDNSIKELRTVSLVSLINPVDEVRKAILSPPPHLPSSAKSRPRSKKQGGSGNWIVAPSVGFCSGIVRLFRAMINWCIRHG
jgi:hypothetical protein